MEELYCTRCRIIKAAINQFSENGYYKTGIRDIANEANVGLGLVNHYFVSKKMLASEVFAIMWKSTTAWTKTYVDVETDPVLYDAVATRAMNYTMLSSKFRSFYIDSLREDIFYQALSVRWVEKLDDFRKDKFNVSDPDLVHLYSRILPYELEKTIILQKQEGFYQNLPYEDIPFYIFLTAFERILPREEIENFDRKSREIVDEHFAEYTMEVAEEEIVEHLKYIDDLKDSAKKN